jgi:putative transposase
MYERRVGRFPGFPYLGPYRYFLTFCTFQRTQLFVHSNIVDECVQEFLRASASHDFELTAYCLMPDHVHMLVEGTAEDSHLPTFASLAKQFSGYRCRHRVEKRLWQDGYYDHVLRDDESTAKVARYLLENPVRAKLAASVYDYPFIGSSRYTREALIEWAYSGA